MSRYVALLRGINLAGRNRIAMGDLRDIVTGLGYEAVETYVQSGNVLFRTAARGADVGPAIERRIADALGLSVTVFVRTAKELARLVERNPYVGRGLEP